MPPTPPIQQDQRGQLLTIMLVALVGSGMVFFLILVSGGFFAYVLATACCIFLVAALHYVVWGQALTEEVARERLRSFAAPPATAPTPHLVDNQHPNSIQR